MLLNKKYTLINTDSVNPIRKWTIVFSKLKIFTPRIKTLYGFFSANKRLMENLDFKPYITNNKISMK